MQNALFAVWRKRCLFRIGQEGTIGYQVDLFVQQVPQFIHDVCRYQYKDQCLVLPVGRIKGRGGALVGKKSKNKKEIVVS